MQIRMGRLASAAALALFLTTASSAQVNEDMAINGWSMEQNRAPGWHLAHCRNTRLFLAQYCF